MKSTLEIKNLISVSRTIIDDIFYILQQLRTYPGISSMFMKSISKIPFRLLVGQMSLLKIKS